MDLLKKRKQLKLLLSFSGGFLLTIIFTHTVPDAYGQFGVATGYFILIGFLIQLVLEYFSRGAEHGHAHLNGKPSKVFPFTIFVSLSLHAFIEAIPLDHREHHHIDDLFWGVFFHKVPVAVTLRTILAAANYSRLQSWIYVLLFACVAPLGLLLGEQLLTPLDVNTAWVLSVTVGMLLHISTTIIFESSEAHHFNLMRLFAILLGVAMGVGMD